MPIEKPKLLNILLKDAIIAGIISSFFFTLFIQPLIGIGWASIKNSGLQVYTEINNHIYASAALGYRNDVERMFFAMFSGLVLGITLVVTINFIGAARGINIVRQSFGNKKFQNFTKTKTALWISRVLGATVVVLLILFAVRITLNSIIIYATTELNTSFQQRLNALKPYISETEEEALLSSWALMKNESDFNKINEQMGNFASINNVELPRVLWPNVLWSDMAWP